MLKVIYQLLMLVAIATIVGHNTLPHHHHIEIQSLAHQDDHNKDESTDTDHHNIFSFAQLDEDFRLSAFSEVSLSMPVLYLLTPVIAFQFNKLKERSKTHFGIYREFPPPGHYSPSLFSRPPPVTFAV